MSPIGSSRPSRRTASSTKPSAGARPRGSFVARTLRSKKKKRFSPSFITAVVGALLVLLIAFALQRTMPLSAPVGEHLTPPDFASMLPAGSQASPAGPLEIPDIPQSSYALGYVTGNGASVAYFRWSRDDQSYHLTTSVALTGGGGRIISMPSLSTLRVGPGAPVAVVARGSEGSFVDGVYVLMPSGNGLVPVQKISEDGSVSVAHFLSVTSIAHVVTVDFGDVNADGDKDAVVSASDTDAAGNVSKTFTVYAWTDGRFAYSKDLTWALTADARVFPQPVAPQKTP